MANINYVKAGEAWFNLNQIDAIYPCPSRMYGDDNWVIIVSGKEININKHDATTVITAIERYSGGYFTTEPAKSEKPVKNSASVINEVRMAAAEINKLLPISQALSVETKDNIIKIKKSEYSYIIIKDGCIAEDYLSNILKNDAGTELLKKLNEILK